MDRQKIFDQVARHLLAQGQRSVGEARRTDGDFVCRYRGADGRSCAIGCLIPDEMYNWMMEGQRVTVLIESWPSLRGVLQLNFQDPEYFQDKCLLLDLQLLHDSDAPVSWRDRLGALAHKWNLSPAVLS